MSSLRSLFTIASFLVVLTAALTQGEASIHFAALTGDLNAVSTLIDSGADLNAKDQYGSTPLTIAITFGHNDVAQAIIESGADLSVPDAYDSAPLHLAAFFARTDVVKTLLEYDADKYARNSDGATAYDLAVQPYSKDAALFRLLEEQLVTFGMKFDMAEIERERPVIAELVRAPPPENAIFNVFRDSAVISAIPPDLMAEFYTDAERHEDILGVMVTERGQPVLEGYFRGVKPDSNLLVQSVSKSYMSALVGIALQQGCLENLDVRLVDFLPAHVEVDANSSVRRITLRQLLQMRGGYPWEELDSATWNRIIEGNYLDKFDAFELKAKPGTEFNYSNFTSYLLGVIVSEACGVDLKEFARENLLEPIGSGEGEWYSDKDGYYYPLFRFTLRDMSKFGELYLGEEGRMPKKNILTDAWVSESISNYSQNVWVSDPPQQYIGRYFVNLGYGYQWWRADVGGRIVKYAAGHGGQLIVLVEDLGVVITLASDPYWRQHNNEAWRAEQGVYNVVGKFISLLPPPRD